jgi:hypothetical protein
MKKIVSIIIVLLFCFTLASLISTKTSTADVTIGTITGTTYQLKGWETMPLPFVRVQAGEYVTFSDINGMYSFTDLPLQTYQVTASKPGFSSQSFTVILNQQNSTAIVDFQLVFKYIIFNGQITNYYPNEVLIYLAEKGYLKLSTATVIV